MKISIGYDKLQALTKTIAPEPGTQITEIEILTGS